MTTGRKKLVLIDSNALIHRAFHALPPLTNKDGKSTGAVYGYALTLFSVLEKMKPEYIVATFDLSGGTFRHKEYKEYKATRTKAPDELYEQIPMVKELLRAFNIPIYEKQGFEADDLIGTISKHPINGDGIERVIVTGDMDTLQLVDDKTKVFTLRKGINDTVIYDEKAVVERFGLLPNQIVDYKALRGDASDNIPGVKGVGEKTATGLLQEFGTLDGVYANLDNIKSASVRKKLEEGKESAYLSQRLATIVLDVPVDFELESAVTHDYDRDKLVAFFKSMGFYSLLKKIGADEEVRNIKTAVSKNKSKEVEISLIDDWKGFEAYIEKIRFKKAVAISLLVQNEDISGIGLSIERGEGVFVGREFLPDFIKVIIGEKIKLVGYDLKEDFKRLSFKKDGVHNLYGGALDGFVAWFDVLVAAYLVNSGEKNDLERLIFEEFGQELKYAEAKKGQVSLLAGMDDQQQKASAEKAIFILELMEIYEEKIKNISQQQEGGSTLGNLFVELENGLVKILAKMEMAGIKVDKNILKQVSDEAEVEIGQLEKKIFMLAGEEFNINSPSQLAAILYEKIGIPTVDIKRGKTGFSTDAEQLGKIRMFHPIVPEIEDYRELFKVKTTYADSLPHLVAIDGRIHTSFNQAVAATGRLSSSDPNLQNIPKRGRMADLIRQAFVADEGKLLVSADYSQIDLRVAAHLSEDERMIEAFKNNKDIHRTTAAWVNDISEEEVTDVQRREAKSLNFGVLYGMGTYGFMRDSGVSRERADFFIKQYMDKFSGLKNYLEKTKEFARKNGYVETELGRRRYVPNINAGNYQVRQAAERVAINLPIQGLSADIMKLAMRDAEEKFLKKINVDKNRAGAILQIHDELIFEVDDDFADDFMIKIKEIMESVYKLRVPLIVEVSKGKSWQEL